MLVERRRSASSIFISIYALACLASGMLSVQAGVHREESIAIASRLQLFTQATSLGGTESLIEHRASVEGPTTISPRNLLRVSVGLENAEDLIEDLDRALG